MTEVNAEIITPFGCQYLKLRYPNKLLMILTQYVDNTILDETKANKLNYGDQLIGDVTQEFKLEEEFMKQVGWLGFLGNCTSKLDTKCNRQENKKFSTYRSHGL